MSEQRVLTRLPHSLQGALAQWEVERIIAMARRGYAKGEIAGELGVSKRTVYRYLAPPRYRCSHCGEGFRTTATAFAHAVVTP